MVIAQSRRWVLAALMPAMLTAGIAVRVSAQANTSGPANISFWTISNYDYNPKEPFEPAPRQAVNTIPPAVRAFEGQKVAIDGNAMALDYSSGMTSEFILQTSADACGFGAMPRINEWIYVKMASGKKIQVSTAMDMTVIGTFHIRETLEGGRVVGLYTIDADTAR
jgi:hypothetical protein